MSEEEKKQQEEKEWKKKPDKDRDLESGDNPAERERISGKGKNS